MAVASASAKPPPVALVAANRALSWIEDMMNLVAAAAIFVLMFIGVIQILGRWLFGYSIYGYIDYIEQSMAIFAFLGVAYCQRLGGHVRMDLLLRGFSKGFMWAMECFGVIVALVIVTLLIDSSWANFVRAWQLGDSTMDIKLPVWPSKLMVPVALSFLWLRLVLQVIDYVRLSMNPESPPVAVPVLESIEEQARQEIEETIGRTEGVPPEAGRTFGSDTTNSHTGVGNRT